MTAGDARDRLLAALGLAPDADLDAVLRPHPGEGDELVACVDTMVEGIHFPADTPPAAVAHKLLAVNLSDLAAMGAEPEQALVSVCPGDASTGWLDEFATGLRAAAERFHAPVTALTVAEGPLTLTAELHGRVPAGMALRRDGARPGDAVYVTGTLGDAAAALGVWSGELEAVAPHAGLLRRRLDRPEPRLAAGRQLRGLASACIDVSDGLAADLGHVLAASGVGATLRLEQLPLSAPMIATLAHADALLTALRGGDDYELCFCVAPGREAVLATRAPYLECAMRRIGVIEAEPGLRCVDARGGTVDPAGGWLHFH